MKGFILTMRERVLVFSIIMSTLLFVGCTEQRQVITFRGLATDDDGGIEGLFNPERGFRLEAAVDVSERSKSPTLGLDTLAVKYASDSVSLAQSYMYLTFLVGRPLTTPDFQIMQTYFDRLRQLGLKAVLRFAYEKDFMGRSPIGPTLDEALGHLDQLKPFLEKNKPLILVVQAGVIGAWGEWHSSIHGLENSDEVKRTILNKLLEVVPAEKQIQVRLPEFKNLLKGHQGYNRLSFHDDFIVIKPDKWDGEMHEGTANFNQMVAESPYLLVDGELPWGFWSVGADPDSPSPGWIIDGMATARRLFLQHYTSLSVIHNYKEQHPNRLFDNAHAPDYSMAIWKKHLITPDSLYTYHMPVSDHYFSTKAGKSVQRSVFDYIRDHLGYRLELQQLTMPAKWQIGRSHRLKLTLINRGFATVTSNHPVYFVLIDEHGRVTECPTAAQSIDWQPHQPGDATYTPLLHTVSAEISLPGGLPSGTYRLGFWLPDASETLKYDSRYAIRCANGDTTWWLSADKTYGVNVLTEIDW